MPARPEASHGRPRRFQRGTCGPWRRSRGVRQSPRAQAPARRKPAHQIARIGLVAQPWSVVAGRQDHRHPIMDFGHHLVGLGGDYRERPDPFTRCWLFPVLPQPSDAERRALLHRNGIRPRSLLSLDRFPLEEAKRWASRKVGRSRPVSHLALIGLRPPLGLLAPVRNSPQRNRLKIERLVQCEGVRQQMELIL